MAVDNELGSWRFFPTTALNLRSSGGVIKRQDKRDAARGSAEALTLVEHSIGFGFTVERALVGIRTQDIQNLKVINGDIKHYTN